MSKLRVLYATKTNHSKKIALAMGNALNIQADNILEGPVQEEVDILFLVGGIYGGESLPELLEFVKKLDRVKVKNVVLVTSCVSKKQGQNTVRKLLGDKEIPVIGEFICQGSFLFFKFGHPNKNDIQEAVDFAVGLSERI